MSNKGPVFAAIRIEDAVLFLRFQLGARRERESYLYFQILFTNLKKGRFFLPRGLRTASSKQEQDCGAAELAARRKAKSNEEKWKCKLGVDE
jgi:hypothetical protein